MKSTTFRFTAVLALVLSLISLSISTEAQNLFTADRMMEVARVGSPVVSPDGLFVLYTVTRVNPQTNSSSTHIFRKALAGGESLDLGSGGSPIWRPDGRKIGFMRGGQLWEMDPDGTNAAQVTDIPGGIGNVLYSPDARYLSFTRNIKLAATPSDLHPDLPSANARLYDGLMYRHWDTFHDGTFRHLHIAPYTAGRLTGEPVNIMAGEPYDTPLKPFGGVTHITWRPDSKAIVYTSKKLSGAEAAYSTDSDLYEYELESGITSNLTEGMPGYDFYPAYSPDGRYLAWLSMETPMYEADRYRLMLLDTRTGQRRELSAGFDQNVNNHQWSADSRTIYFLSGIQATVQLYAYELNPRRNQPSIRKITDGTHDYTGFAISTVRNRTELVASRMSMSAPTELFRVDPATGRETAFTTVNAEILATTAMGRVEKRWVTTTDEKQMLVWVIYPPNFDPDKKYPALLYAQGGPQGTVSQFFSYRWNFQVMAANDYIIVAPNRRGLPSFGQAWNLQISGDWGGQAMQDLLSAIDHVAAEPFVDNERLGAVGASFGGYSVFWLAGNHENRFKTFISHAGVFHLESMYGETEEMFFVDHDLGGAYWDNPRPVSYDLHSPHLSVSKWNTPIMMIHGELDYRVPVGQSYQAFTAAQRLGIPSRMLLFPNENHWILTPQNSLLWHREFFNWLDTWLK
jgi:dipeptidyl aminopeptidase/acylaminoacyl peptidase